MRSATSRRAVRRGLLSPLAGWVALDTVELRPPLNCKVCGRAILEGTSSCVACGAPVVPNADAYAPTSMTPAFQVQPGAPAPPVVVRPRTAPLSAVQAGMPVTPPTQRSAADASQFQATMLAAQVPAPPQPPPRPWPANPTLQSPMAGPPQTAPIQQTIPTGPPAMTVRTPPPAPAPYLPTPAPAPAQYIHTPPPMQGPVPSPYGLAPVPVPSQQY